MKYSRRYVLPFENEAIHPVRVACNDVGRTHIFTAQQHNVSITHLLILQGGAAAAADVAETWLDRQPRPPTFRFQIKQSRMQYLLPNVTRGIKSAIQQS